MFWKNWNKANKTLLFAFTCFLFAILLNREFPANTFAEFFLFIAEAALVGGIADWFAVTALFEKPLGFPYHTAILPRRRDEFIEATSKLLLKEFFTKTRLLELAKGIDLPKSCYNLLSSAKVKGYVIGEITAGLGKLQQLTMPELVKFLRSEWQGQNPKELLQANLQNLADNSNAKAFIADVSRRLYDYAKGEKRKEAIKQAIDKQIESYGGDAGDLLMAFAKGFNIVNSDDATEIIHSKILVLLEELQQPYSKEQETVLLALERGLGELLTEREADLQAIWNGLISDNVLQIGAKELVGDNLFADKAIVTAIDAMYTAWVESILTDTEQQKLVHNLLYDVVARAFIGSREIIANVARDVLNQLTPAEINKLVYYKVEEDLLWIRMNGSIVGSVIGAVIFIIRELLA